MIAIFASRFDEPTREAAEAWRLDDEVALLTIADLLSGGWAVRTGSLKDSRIVVGGRARHASEVAGLINLMPCVYDFELLSVPRRDRDYVGAELTAFLVWWLNAMPCPVINRPTPGSLNGPAWQQEQWVRACRRAQIPVSRSAIDTSAAMRRSADDAHELSVTRVVRGEVCGEQYTGECRTLAAIAETEFLEVSFREDEGGWIFHRVDVRPPIHRLEVRTMLERVFERAQIQ